MKIRGRAVAVATLLVLFGCDDGASEDAVDAAVDQGPVEETAEMAEMALARFCEETAVAKCGWAFECVPPAEVGGVLGLAGPDEAACVAAEVAACHADGDGRLARGTMALASDGIDPCVNKLLNAPCQPSPSDWVSDWHRYVANSCAGVVRGNVGVGGACQRAGDCQDGGHVCVDDACRDAEMDDLLETCDGAGGGGSLTTDLSCAGEVCLQTSGGGQCSADCRDGQGCPGGAFCIAQQGTTFSWYCTAPCDEDADCGDDFTCVVVNALNPDGGKHCLNLPTE